MTSSLEARVQAVDAATLTPIALKALGRTSGKLPAWSISPIRPPVGNWGSSVIYRFSGDVQDGDETVPWSLVLKVSSIAIGAVGVASKEAKGWREAALYRSALIDEIPPGFRPPRCYLLDERSDESGQSEVWFWLEDLGPDLNRTFDLADHRQVAHGLGLLNGTFIDPSALAHAPWLSRGNVRTYVDHAEPYFHALFVGQPNPLMQRAFPAASVESLSGLWQSRQAHLETLDRLPQTLCHGDTQGTNVYLLPDAIGHLETVAIDWEAVGLGPVGLDAAQLLCGSLFQTEEQPADLAHTIYAGYLSGIQAAGWMGDPRHVRLGYTASAIRSRAMVVMRTSQMMLDDAMQKRIAPWLKARGITLEDLADRACRAEQCLDELFQESLALRDQLL